jgi:polyferredoxin
MAALPRAFIPRTPMAADDAPLAIPIATGAGTRPVTARRRKPFTRRAPGQAPLIRGSVQAAFLLLNLWIGVRFVLFVRYYETGGATLYVPRPAGVEGWLPIAALMNLKYWVFTGALPAVHPAGLFLLLAFAGGSLLFRKAFCSWLCPVGTISEWLWMGGEAMFGRNLSLPRWIDVPLRGLKYILLALFVYAVASMPPDAIRGFLESPYGVIADVKMLVFFRTLGTTAALVIAFLLVASVVVKHAWCRYLCPYGALMGLVALASPSSIRRNADACIDCAKCAKACPSRLPVDRLAVVRSPECSACLACVTACPVKGALDLSIGIGTRRTVLPAWSVAAGVLALFLGLVGTAHATGHWHTDVPDAIYFDFIPRAAEFGHPGR